MVSPTIRSEWSGTARRNPYWRLAWAETVYSRSILGPLPPSRELDRRDNRAYPHPQNPGLIENADGYYDWAGRRLFLKNGEPDPDTPGAYRYQTRPDLTDLEAPDWDPMSPRYEPCWETGRRRHSELSDLHPQSAWRQGDMSLPDFVWDQASANTDSRCEYFRRELEPDPEPGPYYAPPSAEPYRESWDAAETDDTFRFSSLQELAWKQFEIDSEPLAAANRESLRLVAAEQDSPRGRLLTAVVRLGRWVVGRFRGPVPVSPISEPAAALQAEFEPAEHEPAELEPAARPAVPAAPVAVQAALPGRAPRPQEPAVHDDLHGDPSRMRPEPEPRLPRFVFDGCAVDR